MSEFCTFSKGGTLWKFTKTRGFEQSRGGQRSSGETQVRGRPKKNMERGRPKKKEGKLCHELPAKMNKIYRLKGKKIPLTFDPKKSPFACKCDICMS